MTDLFDVSGLVAAITGSSRGVGLGIARAFLDSGARVVINGHDASETAATAETLTTTYGQQNVVPLAGDVTDPAVAQALIDKAVSAFGALDHLVCNAGIDIIKPAVDYTPDDWERIVTVNLRGAFQPAQAAGRHWIAAGLTGSITMTSSLAGSIGIPTLAPYAASKGGINQLVRTLAAEWAEHRIRVNAIAPGYIDNIMTGVTAHDDPSSDARIRTFTPLGRRAAIAEIAAPFVFLASPAASYVTGSILAVDGGYTAT